MTAPKGLLVFGRRGTRFQGRTFTLLTAREPKKLLGFIPVYGLLHAERENVTATMPAFWLPPHLRRHRERGVSRVRRADRICAASNFIRDRHQTVSDLRDTIVRMVFERLPETMQEAKDYTSRTLDIENLIVDKMNKLSPEQYESILRPVFNDDEMLVVMVGAVLGFLVGELQVVLVEHFSHAVH